jgi:hypothetical protein
MSNNQYTVEYRFPEWKGESWSSKQSHEHRYNIIKPYLGDDSVGVELGVFKGGLAEFLLPHCKTLYLVDVWDTVPGYWDDLELAKISRLSVESMYESDNRVVIKPQLTWDFLESVPDEHFDFIYLDASHGYQRTLRHLSVGFKKLKVGGHFIGDDYAGAVELAVNHFCSGYHIDLITIERQWTFIK